MATHRYICELTHLSQCMSSQLYALSLTVRKALASSKPTGVRDGQRWLEMVRDHVRDHVRVMWGGGARAAVIVPTINLLSLLSLLSTALYANPVNGLCSTDSSQRTLLNVPFWDA